MWILRDPKRPQAQVLQICLGDEGKDNLGGAPKRAA
jgi:hypothetical protein